MKKIFCFLFFLIASIQAAQAFEVDVKKYKFCNSYEFKFAFLKIYDVFLCNNQAQNLDLKNLYNQDFTLVIQYSQNIKSQKLVEASIDEIKKNNQLNADNEKNYAAKLAKIFPNVKTTDIITASFQASSGATVFTHNNKKTGEILERDFSQKFLDIWLGKNASYPKMRDAFFAQKKLI
jgi:hypothetical protein